MNGNPAYDLSYEAQLWEEIIDGKVVMMAPASINHGRIKGNIAVIFSNYLHGRKCEYFPDGTGLYLSEREEYIPDGMIVCDPDKVTEKGIIGAPDFVLEVLSRSTAYADRGHKKEIYEKYGVREYWIVSPEALSIEQYVLENGSFVLRNVFHKYTEAELADMKEKERSTVVKGFHCTLFDDLVIRIDDVFGRVTIR